VQEAFEEVEVEVEVHAALCGCALWLWRYALWHGCMAVAAQRVRMR
jgi:hypothetical protein